jgi:16S rRNA (adenine1518-N6/adenine1519-N6)-dimethyltransferase
VQSLKEIRALLNAHGLFPKHRYGQNFLHDANAMTKIMDAAKPGQHGIILEVGPGTGALTERLLEAGGRVLAVEIDREMYPILHHRLNLGLADVVRDDSEPSQFLKNRANSPATLYLGDALAGKHHLAPAIPQLLAAMAGTPISGENAPEKANLPPFSLIANLPYHIASPLLANLATDFPTMQRAVVMVQKEVADRLTAPPGGKDYGALGIVIQASCNTSKLFTLSPGCFWPPPQIDSAVVLLERRPTPLTNDLPRLSRALHTLFSKRRKQIGAILGRSKPFPPGIDPNSRPEQLTVDQLVQISLAFDFDTQD